MSCTWKALDECEMNPHKRSERYDFHKFQIWVRRNYIYLKPKREVVFLRGANARRGRALQSGSLSKDLVSVG
jgi:hypothetical protein